MLDDYIQKRYLIDTEVITNLIPYRFEEKQFWGVDNFNEYLEKYYGDYMSLPPENERLGHDLLECVIKKDYKEYFR